MLLLLACTHQELDSGITVTPTPYMWKAKKAQRKAVAALDMGLPSIIELRSTYASYMIHRTSSCPTMENQESSSWIGVWQSYCNSSGGYSFDGQALYNEVVNGVPIQDEPPPHEESGDEWYLMMVASFSLTDPQGAEFIGGGEFENLWQSEQGNFGENIIWEGRIGGTYKYTGGSGWIEDGESSLFWEASEKDGIRTMLLNGGVGWPELELYFHQLLYQSDQPLSGEIWIRDPSHYWWKVSMNGNCGIPYWNNEPQAEICLGNKLSQAIEYLFEEHKNERENPQY